MPRDRHQSLLGYQYDTKTIYLAIKNGLLDAPGTKVYQIDRNSGELLKQLHFARHVVDIDLVMGQLGIIAFDLHASGRLAFTLSAMTKTLPS